MHGLLLAVAAMTQAQGPIHYKVESASVTDIDMSGMGMAAQHIAMKSTGLVTVTIKDTVGGRVVHAVIDSIVFDDGGMMAMAAGQLPPEATASAKGTFYHIYVPTGKPIQPAPPSTGSMAASIMAPAVMALFPVLKPTMKAGDTWADTVKKDSTITSAMGSMTGAVSSITTWKVSGKTGNDYSLDASVDGTTTAALPGGMGGNMEMKSTGTQHLVGPVEGPLKQGTIAGTGDGKMTMMGSSIPIKSTTTITFVVVP